MVGVVFVYVDTVYGFSWVFFFMLSWMFQHDYLDTYCFECLKYMCFAFLYLHLFSATAHVSHGKALEICSLLLLLLQHFRSMHSLSTLYCKFYCAEKCALCSLQPQF